MEPASPDPSARATWHILGGARVEVAGRRVPLGPRLRFALGCLLIEPGRPVPAEALAGIEWQGATPAATAGRIAIRRLRVALANAGIEAGVSTTPGGYALDVDPHSVDHAQFERFCRAADNELWSDKAWRHADRARRAWTGRPFGDLGDHEAFRSMTARLEEQHRLLLDHWGELALQAGVQDTISDVLLSDVDSEPLRERRWASLALARYRSGNQAAALRTIVTAREQLAEAVGLEPGRDLQRLEQQILAQDPELDWRPTQPRSGGAGRLRAGPVVVGRDAEVDDIVDLLDRHRVVVLEGPGGIGKSTVAAEVCRRVPRPSVWVDLTTIDGFERVLPAIAGAMELSSWATASGAFSSVTDQLQRSSALLVLDNADEMGDVVAEATIALVTNAPAIRVIITSRTSVPVSTAIVRSLAPLRAGEPDQPGPAALLSADLAGIPRAQITEQWSMVEALCERSGGVPLAIRLLAASADVDQPIVSAGTPVSEVVGDAVRVALDHLPAGALDLVTTIVDLPGGATVPLLARVLASSEPELRRSVGAALRAGVAVETPVGDHLQVRLLDPVTDVLRPFGPDPDTGQWLTTRITASTIEAIDVAQPSLIGRADLAVFGAIDDDHETLLWVLSSLAPQERLRLANRLAPVWSHCGRSAEGAALLSDLRAVAEEAAPIERARYWVMRAQVSPALSERARFVDELEVAMVDADRLGHLDLATRAAAELALGRGWAGDAAGATSLLDKFESRTQLDDFGLLTLRSMRSIGRALLGDAAGALEALMTIADEFDSAGMVAEAVGALNIALSIATLAGDEWRASAILERAAAFVPDRFTGYSVAAMKYRRAQHVWLRDDRSAGPLLFDAHAALLRYGENQWAPACLADLGWWRTTHGDREGQADLAAATMDLLRVWPAAASLGLARLAALVAHDGLQVEARSLAAAAMAPRPEISVRLTAAEHTFVTTTAHDLLGDALTDPPDDDSLHAVLLAMSQRR